LLDRIEKMVEVGNISPNSGAVAAEFCRCIIKLGLSTTAKGDFARELWVAIIGNCISSGIEVRLVDSEPVNGLYTYRYETRESDIGSRTSPRL
jgi:hypothetical protein